MSRRFSRRVATPIIAVMSIILGIGLNVALALVFFVSWNYFLAALFQSMPISFMEALVYCGLLIFATGFVAYFAMEGGE